MNAQFRSATRRKFLSRSLQTAAAGLAIPSLSRLWPLSRVLAQALTPLDKAYVFLDNMMDLYFQGGTVRLVQSYVSTPTFNTRDVGYTYDNAVMLVALLQRGQTDDITRATVLGDSLVYGQTKDSFADGRVRNAYHTDPYINSNGTPNVAPAEGGTYIGNMAWVGLALVQLYHATSNQAYLTAALNAANFVQTNAYDTRGAGGYTGGFKQSQSKITWKATEHNIDLYGFFTLLAAATGDSAWTTAAQHALSLIEAMWNPKGGYFWTGTGDDGATVNKIPIPEDVQNWSYLSTGLSQYQNSIGWAAKNLAAKDGVFSGVSFSNSDVTGVWFEGTGHIAAALLARNLAGDAKKAAAYLADIELGQAQAPNTNGYGIDAASKDGLNTGEGGQYFAALHIGATAWYCIAKQAGNPYRFPPAA